MSKRLSKTPPQPRGLCKPLIEGVSSFKVDLLVSVEDEGRRGGVGSQSLVKVKLWLRLRSLFLF